MTISNADVGANNKAWLHENAKAVGLRLKKADDAAPNTGASWLRKVGDSARSNLPCTPKPQHNHLLAALSADAQSRIFPHLELVPLELGKVLYEAGDALRHVYFPINSIVSLLSVMESGASAEISVVGSEGIIGISSFMGSESTSGQAVVFSAGHAYRLHVQRLRDECNRHGEMLQLMLRYTQALLTQMAQTAACNRHHSIHQQLCRWLLLALDRLPTNQMTMTQEQIANMLGVRREGVTNAAGKLQKLGVIEYCRGHITVLDRAKLEELSCECYAMVKKETDRLLPFPAPRPKSIEWVRRTTLSARLTPSMA